MPLLLLTSLDHVHEADGSAAALSKPLKPVRFYESILKILANSQPAGRAISGELVVDRAQFSGKGPALKILLAEDNTVSQNVFLLLLERLGYRADLATNGREVVEACHNETYDVVLMDLQMPEMDGFEATRRIRSEYAGGDRPCIVAMTAHALRGDRERCLAAGMDDYLSKPVRMEHLKTVLERVVAIKHPHEDLSSTTGNVVSAS